MSADKITVEKVINQLKKYPKEMLVVGFGIDGFNKGEKFDGVEIYKQAFDEFSDGFVPIREETIDVERWEDIRDKNASGFGEECVVISPISKNNIFDWCGLD